MRKHRVALVGLALAHQPQVKPTVDDPVLIAFLDFRLQSNAVQFFDIESLVVLAVDGEVFPEVAGFRKMQNVLVAKFAGW